MRCSEISENVTKRTISGRLHLLEYWRDLWIWSTCFHSLDVTDSGPVNGLMTMQSGDGALCSLHCPADLSVMMSSRSVSAPSATVASSHVRQFGIWNVPCVIEKLNFEFYLIYKKLSSHKWLLENAVTLGWHQQERYFCSNFHQGALATSAEAGTMHISPSFIW